MAWGSKVSATQLATVTTEQFFSFGGSQVLSLNPGERMHAQFDINFSGTTDHTVISFYTTLDDSSENWDDTPFMVLTVPNVPDPGAAACVIEGVYKFRIGCKRSGTTDTITTADASYRKDGVSQ